MNDGIRRLLTRACQILLPPSGLALAAALALAAPAAQAGPHLLLELETGRVLAQSEAGRPWYPASVTKLMTAYLAFQAMREGRAGPLSLLRVSDYAVSQPPSKMGFKPGTQVTLDNAIKMLMVRSANDIAVTIAEGVSGSETDFVREMNRAAVRLGMDGTRFVNPHGLPDEGQVTTARDMAILARALIREFPEFEFYFRIPAIQIGKRVIRNHNRLIDRYPGADGMKTGFICASGFNMVAGAKRDGRRLIAVVFGAYSATQRAEDAARLLERGFVREPVLAGTAGFGFDTVESIRNLLGDARDMREEMCNPKRRRPAAESDIDEDEEDASAAAAADAKGRQAVKGKQAAKGKQAKAARQSLLGPLNPSMPPIRVFTGPPAKAPEAEIVQPVSSERQAAPRGGPSLQ